MENTLKRLVARKARISELLEGEFVKLEGWEPNYVLTREGRRISRVNVAGTIVSVEPGNRILGLDDGTGSINLRYFQDASFPDKIGIGEIVFVIGKIRRFGDETYINPEAIDQKDSALWLKMRSLELAYQEL